MPTAQFTKVNVNEVCARPYVFEAQFNAVGKPRYDGTFLNRAVAEIDADADLLHKAFSELVLNALDACPPAAR